jgi:hypothetical protein
LELLLLNINLWWLIHKVMLCLLLVRKVLWIVIRSSNHIHINRLDWLVWNEHLLTILLLISRYWALAHWKEVIASWIWKIVCNFCYLRIHEIWGLILIKICSGYLWLWLWRDSILIILNLTISWQDLISLRLVF